MLGWNKTIMLVLVGMVVSFMLAQAFVFGESDDKPATKHNNVVNVAHRGASGLAPENTIPSYTLALEMGADAIEIDLQMTKDGTLIAMHDEQVNRTTSGKGFVGDMTLDEVKELDAGSWFNQKYPEHAQSDYVGLKVPTLEEILTTFGADVIYYIELKSPQRYQGMEEALMKLLETYEWVNANSERSNVVIQSFSRNALLAIRSMNQDIPLIQLVKKPAKGKRAEHEIAEISRYANGIGANVNRINRTYVKKARNAGLLFQPYTVNERDKMEMVLSWGVTGIFTNYPGRLDKVLER